jgi:hypothetical protein
MLRLSADNANQAVDIQVVNGDGDGGIAHGCELKEFAEAIATRDEVTLLKTRDRLLDCAGSNVMVDAAAVAANFQRMVRIADSTGIPVDNMMSALSGSIGEELDLHRFSSAANTPPRGVFSKLTGGIARALAKRLLRLAHRNQAGK